MTLWGLESQDDQFGPMQNIGELLRRKLMGPQTPPFLAGSDTQPQSNPQLGATPPSVPPPNLGQVPTLETPEKRPLWKTILGGLGSAVLGGEAGARDFLNAPKEQAQQKFDDATKSYQLGLQGAELPSKLGLTAAQTDEASANALKARTPVDKSTTTADQTEQEYQTWATQQTASSKPSDRMAFAAAHAAAVRAPDKAPVLVPGRDVPLPAGVVSQREAMAQADRTPKEPTENDKVVSDYLATNKLPNTPENRMKARTGIAADKTTAEFTAKVAQIKATLRDSSQQGFKNMTALFPQDTPAANYEFLMNFIGVSYEGVRGARLNRAEIERAANTRTLPDQLQNAYDLYVKRKILTPQQKQDMIRSTKAIVSTYDEPDQAATGSPAGAASGIKISRDAQGRIVGVE